MSLYTQSDYDSLKSAYISLMAGEKTVQASVGGEFVRFQDIQLAECKRFLNEIATDLGLVVTRAYAKHIGRFD